MAKKWLPVPGFIGFVTLIAGFLIQDYVLLLSKWNSITRYPVIFNFRVGTGRVLEKKFGTGRVPGSRQILLVTRNTNLPGHLTKEPRCCPMQLLHPPVGKVVLGGVAQSSRSPVRVCRSHHPPFRTVFQLLRVRSVISKKDKTLRRLQHLLLECHL